VVACVLDVSVPMETAAESVKLGVTFARHRYQCTALILARYGENSDVKVGNDFGQQANHKNEEDSRGG
jgi:hypothetical protein